MNPDQALDILGDMIEHGTPDLESDKKQKEAAEVLRKLIERVTDGEKENREN